MPGGQKLPTHPERCAAAKEKWSKIQRPLAAWRHPLSVCANSGNDCVHEHFFWYLLEPVLNVTIGEVGPPKKIRMKKVHNSHRREENTAGTSCHAPGVHFRSKDDDRSIFAAHCLEALKQALAVVEHCGGLGTSHKSDSVPTKRE